ncbi:MAG: conjugal transfer protein TraG N-terminal domain-containing protein, partial [Burkholderiaceae bacterium]|nr:conjugal transfer protein TraG N-terminal domain-containing protein [Burkholderiaceae bacterium]
MNFELFAYWNGAQIRDLFEIIVSITSGPDFLGLLRTMALLGILCVMTIAALRYRGMDAISFFMAIVVFYTVLLVPKVDLTIRDDRAGSVHVVQHVPLGVAFLASTTS